ncbi:MAG: hypothetical protein ABIH03_11535, partial [Pseudomonadota bacterium]
AGALGLTTSAAGLVAKVIQSAKEDFRQLLEMQSAAANSQQTMADAVGKFIGNNPQLTPQQVSGYVQYAEAGAQRGRLGPQGPQTVMAGLTALRGGASDVTDQQQLEAMDRALLQKRLDPSTDLGSYSTAIAKTMKATKLGAAQAHNILGMYGALAGGDIGTLADQVSRLTGVAAGTTTKATDVLAMHAFLTTAMGDKTGEESTTMVASLLGRVGAKDVKMGGKKVKLQGENELEQLMSGLERAGTGEWGDKQKATFALLKQFGRAGAAMTISAAQMQANPEEIQRRRQMIAEGGGPGVDFAQAQLATKAEVARGSAGVDESKLIAGRKEQKQLQDTAGANWARMGEDIKSWKATQGITTGFDWTMGLRQWQAQRGDTTAGQFFESEKQRAAFGAVQSRLGGDFFGQGSDVSLAEVRGKMRGLKGKSAEDILRFGATEGAVNPAGGIDSVESSMLQLVGISQQQIDTLNQMRDNATTEAQKQAYMDAFQAMMDSFSGAVADGVRRGSSSPQTLNVDN